MSKFQLWSRDEYGQGSILMTSEDLDEVIKRARAEVTDINVNNALTATDRENNWEAYYLQVISEEDTDEVYFYGGNHGLDNVFYSFDKGSKSFNKIKLSDIPKVQVRAYLGNISPNRHKEEDWFGLDSRRNLINKADHPDLEGKTKYFIQPI